MFRNIVQTYTARNATDLLQVVNFTDLLQLVDKLIAKFGNQVAFIVTRLSSMNTRKCETPNIDPHAYI